MCISTESTVMRNLLFFFFLLMTHQGLLSQATTIQLIVEIDGNALKEGFKIELSNGEASVQKQVTGKNGRVTFKDLEQGNVYHISVARKDKVPKTFLIDDQKWFYPEESSDTEILLEVEMVKKLDFVNYTIITKSPVGKMNIDKASGELNWNEPYNQKRKLEIDNFLSNAKQLSIEGRKSHNLLLDSVQGSIASNKLDLAQKLLSKASKIKETKEVKNLSIKLQAAIVKGNNENEMINKIFTVADSLFDSGELNKALKYYKRIVRLDPNNTIAENQISQINDMLAINNIKEKDLQPPTTSTSEILTNARKAQERRIEASMNYR